MTKKEELKIKVGDLVEAKHYGSIKYWRVKEINIGLSGKIHYYCEAACDTKKQFGFDKMGREFTIEEIIL